MKDLIQKHCEEIKNLWTAIANDLILIHQIERAYSSISNAFKNGNKILIFGNGGSGAESTHFAGEFVAQFQKRRKPLPAISLVDNIAAVTAISNDFGYKFIFARQIDTFAKPGDVVIAFTTSDVNLSTGHSENVYLGLFRARQKNLHTVGFVSKKTQLLLPLLDVAMQIPHEETQYIQLAHLDILHAICEKIDADEELSTIC